MDDASRIVARQYEAYAYPRPLADLDAAVAAGYVEPGEPSRYSPLLWPEGRPAGQPLRLLCAGCGTVQAAYLAHRNRDCEVVGLDLSAASLAHERYLQERHGLANLRLFQGDVLEAERLGGPFDFIACTGVLHHLADPGAGLRALARVLAPDGAMLLMVYGATARAGVYLLQDALRRLQVPQSAAGVQFVRTLLAQLPAHHYVRWYQRGATELEHDAALVDTFLHPQDRAYTVPQLLEWLARNGLAWQAWLDNGLYFADGALDAFGPEVREAVTALPPPEQWAVVESLTLALGLHTCTVRHAGQASAMGAPAATPFDGDDWPGLQARWMPGLQRLPGGPGAASGMVGMGTPGARYRRGSHTLDLGPTEAALFERADSGRSLGQVLDSPTLATIAPAERLQRGRAFFARLWRLGHLMVSRG
jgi:SAM-dependent methyltransferase